MTDIYEIAEYTLKALKNCGADAAQCIVGRSKKDELNVDGGKFSLMRSTFNTSISMKAIKDGKKGVTSINQATKEAIDEAATQCIAAAESSVPRNPEPEPRRSRTPSRPGAANPSPSSRPSKSPAGPESPISLVCSYRCPNFRFFLRFQKQGASPLRPLPAASPGPSAEPCPDPAPRRITRTGRTRRTGPPPQR